MAVGVVCNYVENHTGVELFNLRFFLLEYLTTHF